MHKRRYCIRNRDDYRIYNTIAGECRKLAHRLAKLPPTDPFRLRHERLLLEKLYNFGVIQSQTQSSVIDEQLSVSAFCKRRLGVLMAHLKMAESVSMGVKFVEQGHVRVGNEVIRDPAYLVSRDREDYVSWWIKAVLSAKYRSTMISLMIMILCR